MPNDSILARFTLMSSLAIADAITATASSVTKSVAYDPPNDRVAAMVVTPADGGDRGARGDAPSAD